MAFTSQITGSPFTTPQSNITAMAYTNVGGVKRIYYASANDFTKIFCMSTTGTADTSREISIQNQGDARTSTCYGLASDGTYLYAITGALGNQYLHVYRLSDRTYIANAMLGFHADHYARGIATFPRPGRTTEQRIDLLQDNIVRSYIRTISGSSVTLSQQNDGTFALPTNEMVTSGDWQSIAWDSTTERLLIVAEQTVPRPGFPGNFTDRDKVFGFTYTGGRDEREDFLPGIDADAMTYNDDDDDLYMVHETAVRLYAWGDFPRWRLGNANLNITEGTDYSLDLKPLVDTGSTIAIQTNTNTSFYDNLVLGGDGVINWSDPPAPQGGATQQTVPLTIRATLGGNSTDQVFLFVLHAMARPAVGPAWGPTAFPTQIMYEPYTPPAGAPTPNIRHGFQLNLSDFLSAGTPPFTFSATRDGTDFPGTFNITTRYVNQQPIRDRLVFNAIAVAASQLDRYIDITAVNTALPGGTTQRMMIEVINLMYPSWDTSQTTFMVSDTGSHSFNLRDISTGEPQTDIEIVGTPPTQVNAHITNGILTIRAASLGMSGPQSYTVNATLKNILTTTAGVQTPLTINVAQMQLPNTAPVWLPSTFTFTANSGQTQRIDLNQYIQSSHPSPDFSVSAPSGVLGTIMGSIESQHFFEFTIPSTITQDYSATVDITARNSVDSSVKTFNIRGVYTATAAWNRSAIPTQTSKAGAVWELDLKQYVTGAPTPTIAFHPTPSGANGNATLVNGVARWEVPDSETTNVAVNFGFRASNAGGHDDLALIVHINNQVEPSWKPDPIVIAVTEGDTVRQPLDAYVMGNPTPTLHLASDVSDIPGPNSISFDGLTIIITPTIEVISQLAFNFNVIAQSPLNSATKQITVDVTPIFRDNTEIVLTKSDYNEIRALVNTRLTATEVSDMIIAGDTVLGGAVAWANNRMPIIEGNPRSLEALKAKRRAILYMAAACLVTSVREPRDLRIEGVDLTEFQQAQVLKKKAEESAILANEHLDSIGLVDEGLGFIFEVVGRSCR